MNPESKGFMTLAREEMRELRLRDIANHVKRAIDRNLVSDELNSLRRLNDQDLHLLAAAFDNMAVTFTP